MTLYDLSPLNLAVVLAAVFLAGLIDSIAGGGALLSIPAYLFIGLPPHLALGTNKLSSMIGTVFASARFAYHRKVHWPTAAASIALSFAGSFAGARLVLLVPGAVIRGLLMVLIPLVTALVLLRKPGAPDGTIPGPPTPGILAIAGFIGLLIGAYDGFFGPGTGTFLIIAYTALLRFDLTTASGNAKLINLASNVGALATFLSHRTVFVELGLMAAVCGIAGNWIGAGLAVKKGSRAIKPVFLLVLAILFGKVVMDFVSAF
ncbi:MAG: TSUP family transporter [Spirochaetes bacterium]|nr:TSUP family transporter [Spirochaetota bacterium]